MFNGASDGRQRFATVGPDASFVLFFGVDLAQ
jgi:hypothetical protein